MMMSKIILAHFVRSLVDNLIFVDLLRK